MDFESSIQRGIGQAADAKLIARGDIPNIPLYMEQVTAFLESSTPDAFLNVEPAFTKMMINNYAKAGIMPRPVNKKYDREHITRLVEIYILKQMFSVLEIKGAFGPQDTDSAEIYDVFEELFGVLQSGYEQYENAMVSAIKEKLAAKGIDDPHAMTQLFMLVSAADAAIKKSICGCLLKDVDVPGQPQKTK